MFVDAIENKGWYNWNKWTCHIHDNFDGFYRGPLNEDVFAAHCTEDKILHPGIQEITEQIHRLLLQVY